jgi:GntP family permease
MGLVGILLGLALLIWLAYRGWTVLLLAPAAAMLAAAFAGQPLLAHWTQTFMVSAAGFLAQFFPIFLLGALFGKLMDDSGSVSAIADYMTKRLGERRAILAVVIAGAVVTYGGVSLFVTFFVLAPMAHALFRAAAIPHRLMPATVALGTSTFTMSALPGTPAIQNAIPMPFLAPRHSQRRGSGSSPPRSCWGSACGGLAGAKPPPGAPAKATGPLQMSPPTQRLKTSSCVSAPRPRASSTRPKSAMAIIATPRRPSRSPRCRSLSSWGSIF